MTASKERIMAAYQRYARNYDFSMKLYRLLGLQMDKYRERVVDLLKLKEGDCVIDLGCGTGLNFPYILKKIGPKGHLIGVDFSSEMLACAQKRIRRSSWENVQLIHSNIMTYEFPTGVNGVISTGVFGYLEEQDEVIKAISSVLEFDVRFVIVDGKSKSRWPLWLFKLFLWISSPYELTEDYFSIDTRKLVDHYFKNTSYEEVYGGVIYILSAWRDSPRKNS